MNILHRFAQKSLLSLKSMIRAPIDIALGGFVIGPAQFQGIQISYSLSGVSFFGNSTSNVFYAMPGASEIAALYDTYRIDKFEMSWNTNKMNDADSCELFVRLLTLRWAALS